MLTQQWAIETSQDGQKWDRLQPRFRSKMLASAFATHNLPRRNIHIQVVPVMEPPAIRRDSVSPLLSRR